MQRLYCQNYCHVARRSRRIKSAYQSVSSPDSTVTLPWLSAICSEGGVHSRMLGIFLPLPIKTEKIGTRFERKLWLACYLSLDGHHWVLPKTLKRGRSRRAPVCLLRSCSKSRTLVVVRGVSGLRPTAALLGVGSPLTMYRMGLAETYHLA